MVVQVGWGLALIVASAVLALAGAVLFVWGGYRSLAPLLGPAQAAMWTGAGTAIFSLIAIWILTRLNR
jgi:hypothetical protein